MQEEFGRQRGWEARFQNRGTGRNWKQFFLNCVIFCNGNETESCRNTPCLDNRILMSHVHAVVAV